MSTVNRPLIEQASIQAGLAFFWTLGGIGASSLLVSSQNITTGLVGSLIAAGLAFFTKLSLGTGGTSTPTGGREQPK